MKAQKTIVERYHDAIGCFMHLIIGTVCVRCGKYNVSWQDHFDGNKFCQVYIWWKYDLIAKSHILPQYLEIIIYWIS